MPEIDTKPMCDRVVVNHWGTALRPSEAFARYLVCAKVIFVRDDGWALGAPLEHERVAYEAWRSQWVEYRRFPDYEPRPIEEYHHDVRAER